MPWSTCYRWKAVRPLWLVRARLRNSVISVFQGLRVGYFNSRMACKNSKWIWKLSSWWMFLYWLVSILIHWITLVSLLRHFRATPLVQTFFSIVIHASVAATLHKPFTTFDQTNSNKSKVVIIFFLWVDSSCMYFIYTHDMMRKALKEAKQSWERSQQKEAHRKPKQLTLTNSWAYNAFITKSKKIKYAKYKTTKQHGLPPEIKIL